MDQVRLAKKRGKKRLKRKREIQKRWKCHRSTDRCDHAKKSTASKIEPKHATYVSPRVVMPQKTWRD